MTSVLIVFYSFVALTVVSALSILFTKNVIHAILSLLGVFLGVSALYVFAGADFLAISQLVIYIGGVLVLMLFGVMLTNKDYVNGYPTSNNKNFLLGLMGGTGILGILLIVVLKNKTSFLNRPTILNSTEGENSIAIIGTELMSRYVLVFELIGILLLVALIGASFIASYKPNAKN